MTAGSEGKVKDECVLPACLPERTTCTMTAGSEGKVKDECRLEQMRPA
jgi:hypothetical protein